MPLDSIKIDFVIAGQPKSGTTALAKFLSEHPDVCISRPKEPGFFATDLMREADKHHGEVKYLTIRTNEQYSRCFKHQKDRQLLGDATAIYVRSREAAQNIYKNNPEAKIIILLRNPIDFVHSLHMQYINSAVENEEDFAKAFRLQEARKSREVELPPKVRYPSALYYTDQARYYAPLKRYFDIFPMENLLVLTNEEFKANNAKVYKKVLNFLNIDTRFEPSFETVHGSKKPRFKKLNELIYSPSFMKGAHKILPPAAYTRIAKLVHKVLLRRESREPVSEEIREELVENLKDDIEKTSKLLGRDLSTEWNMLDTRR